MLFVILLEPVQISAVMPGEQRCVKVRKPAHPANVGHVMSPLSTQRHFDMVTSIKRQVAQTLVEIVSFDNAGECDTVLEGAYAVAFGLAFKRLPIAAHPMEADVVQPTLRQRPVGNLHTALY